MWRRFREADKERRKSGGRGHKVGWIPGHTSLQEVADGKTSLDDHLGNEFADFLALRGSATYSCPLALIKKAGERIRITKTVQEVQLAVCSARRARVKTNLQECTRRYKEEQEQEEVDLWSDVPAVTPFAVVKPSRAKILAARASSLERSRQAAAAEAQHPSYDWANNVVTGWELGPLPTPRYETAVADLPAKWIPPLLWYWSKLRWASTNDEVGVTWAELAIDFCVATHCPLDKPSPPSLARAAAVLRRASLQLALVCGQQLWPEEEDRVSSLAAWGYLDLGGLRRRPRLLSAAAVGTTMSTLPLGGILQVSADAFSSAWKMDPPSFDLRMWRLVQEADKKRRRKEEEVLLL